MDAHYDQVMRARAAAEAANAPARQYFAYSTILDRAAFEEWRQQHNYLQFTLPAGEVVEALDVDLVYDFPSRWWAGRVAGLADKPSSSVFGRLFTIPGVDWPIVQHKEGAVTSMCVERNVRVRRADGTISDAFAFTTNPQRRSTDGPISPRFVEALIRGAKAAELPADYVARLGAPLAR